MKKKYFVFLLVLPALNYLSGCAGLSTSVPSTRFESSEVPGHLHARFAIGGGTTQAINITDDASNRPVTFDPYVIPSLEFPIGKASLGLSERFEVGVKYGFPSSVMTKGKFQLLGDPASKAKAGNFSLSGTAGIGDSYMGKSGDQNGTFGPGGYNWSAYVSTIIYDAAVIAGYRFTDSFILYGSPFFSAYSMYGSINQAQSDNGLSPAMTYPLSGSGTSYGGNLGAQYYFGQRKRFSIITDLTIQSLQWTGVGAETILGGGVLCEFML